MQEAKQQRAIDVKILISVAPCCFQSARWKSSIFAPPQGAELQWHCHLKGPGPTPPDKFPSETVTEDVTSQSVYNENKNIVGAGTTPVSFHRLRDRS